MPFVCLGVGIAAGLIIKVKVDRFLDIFRFFIISFCEDMFLYKESDSLIGSNE